MPTKPMARCPRCKRRWAGTGRCPACRGTTAQRGYGTAHQRTRAQLLDQLKQDGQTICPRCGQPIHPGQPVDLGHTPDRTAYRGLEHAACNRATNT